MAWTAAWRGGLVNSLHPSPRLNLEVRILKDFKVSVFGSADCKGVTRLFSGSADSAGVSESCAADIELLAERNGWGFEATHTGELNT
jgi:hypothetical protein